jgi:hypothetical protein
VEGISSEDLRNELLEILPPIKQISKPTEDVIRTFDPLANRIVERSLIQVPIFNKLESGRDI